MSAPLVEGGFGNCYLLCTSDGPRNASYNAEDDGPQKGLGPCLPIKSELMPHGKADQYLEVGLVMAKNLANTNQQGYREIKDDKMNKQPEEPWTAVKMQCEPSFASRVHPTTGKVVRWL